MTFFDKKGTFSLEDCLKWEILTFFHPFGLSILFKTLKLSGSQKLTFTDIDEPTLQ
jgi:hypothetical protein